MAEPKNIVKFLPLPLLLLQVSPHVGSHFKAGVLASFLVFFFFFVRMMPRRDVQDFWWRRRWRRDRRRNFYNSSSSSSFFMSGGGEREETGDQGSRPLPPSSFPCSGGWKWSEEEEEDLERGIILPTNTYTRAKRGRHCCRCTSGGVLLLHKMLLYRYVQYTYRLVRKFLLS